MAADQDKLIQPPCPNCRECGCVPREHKHRCLALWNLIVWHESRNEVGDVKRLREERDKL